VLRTKNQVYWWAVPDELSPVLPLLSLLLAALLAGWVMGWVMGNDDSW